MLTPKDFLGDEFYKLCKTDYDELMRFRKIIKGKPTIDQKFQLAVNDLFIDYYKTILFHDGSKLCSCRKCDFQRQEIDINNPYQMDLYKDVPNWVFPKINKIIEEIKNDQ